MRCKTIRPDCVKPSIVLPRSVKVKKTASESRMDVSRLQISLQRLSVSDFSNYSSLISLNDLSSSLVGSNLHFLTLQELEVMTNNFSRDEFLGRGGFGEVYKGFIDDRLKPGLKAQPVAVKVLDLNGSQGHDEWLDYVAKLSDFGLAKDGPQGDDTHISTRVMGTEGYAAPEYLQTGHLTTMCDIYSFGVVLLELLTGKKTVDRNRPRKERYLVKWARPMLKDFNKLEQILDPRLEGQYSTEGVKRAAKLAYQCLRRDPKARPTMSNVVKTLEPLLDLNDIPKGPFVLIVSPEGNTSFVLNNSDEKGAEKEEEKDDNGSHR
ncbi:hypothetical protein Pint_29140 [Pistacia integerrima]|uniref:Uncharacterized protein n=1 Tax=Pistacia integerrima TaxID=434235 RepID=A0ACC0WZK0_9ROSI|nr:hypothetical protein Pint_29140 [Pistacia integerrima]